MCLSILAVALTLLALAQPAAAQREDPLVAFKFGLEIEGKLAAFFISASGIGSESEVVEHAVTDPQSGETIIQKVPGRLIWLDITLTRGMTSSMEISAWRQLVVDGQIADARTNCSIIAYAQDNQEVARWNITNAWPKRVTEPFFDGSNTTHMVEEVIIVHEGVERVS